MHRRRVRSRRPTTVGCVVGPGSTAAGRPASGRGATTAGARRARRRPTPARQQAEGGRLRADAGLVTDTCIGALERAAGAISSLMPRRCGVAVTRRRQTGRHPRPSCSVPVTVRPSGRHATLVSPSGRVRAAMSDRRRARAPAGRPLPRAAAAAVGVAGAKAQDRGASTATVTRAGPEPSSSGPDPVEAGHRMVEAPAGAGESQGGRAALVPSRAAGRRRRTGRGRLPARRGRFGPTLAPQAASSTTTPARRQPILDCWLWTPTAPGRLRSDPVPVQANRASTNSSGSNGDQVVDGLAQADQLHRDAELGLDGEHDAALGRAVELGEHHAGHVDGLGELPGLHQAVLAGGGVEHEEHLGDRARRPCRRPGAPCAAPP